MPDARIRSTSASRRSNASGSPAPVCSRSWASSTRTSSIADRAVSPMTVSASWARSGSVRATYLAPSACAATTAHEWATRSCMSAAIRPRSCSCS